MSPTTFADTLAEAIRQRGIGLERLAQHVRARGLPCSASTLSLWQNGRTRPQRASSLRVVMALEDLLDLDPGALLEAADRPEPGDPAWWDAAVDPQSIFTGGEVVARLKTEWGIPEVLHLHREYLQETLYVQGRRRVRLEVTQILRASQPGHHRFAAVYSQTVDPELGLHGVWRPEVLSGAKVWRRAEFPERGLSVASLQLDGYLQVDELAQVRYVLEPDRPEPLDDDAWHDHALTPLSPVGRLSLAVVFLDEPPRRLERSVVRLQEGVVEPVGWEPLATDGAADISAMGVLGTGLGIRWSFEQGAPV